MRKTNSKFLTNFISEAGGKMQNKDYFAFVELDFFAMYIIADGIDDDNELNSAKIAISSIIRLFTESQNMKKRNIINILERVNRELINESIKFSLKCSITILLTDYIKYRYVSIGNTRFYLYRDSNQIIKSKDQSLTEQLLDSEKIALDKVAIHEERNNLYCYLGQHEKLEPFISKKEKFKDGDIVLLLTRGIWENIDDGELKDSIEDVTNPKDLLDNAEELLLSKQIKDLENYTIATIFINKVYTNPKRKAKIKKILMILIPILIILIIISIIFYFNRRNRRIQVDNMNFYIESGQEYLDNNNFVRANEEFREAISLGRNLRLTDTYTDLDSLNRYIERIIEADNMLASGRYIEAQTTYLGLLVEGFYFNNVGASHINRQLDRISNYMRVFDLINLGDFKRDINDIEGAKEAYREARDLATSLHLRDARQEAEEKLREILQEEADSLEEERRREDELEEIRREIEEEERRMRNEREALEREADLEARRLSQEMSMLQIEQQGRALEIEREQENTLLEMQISSHESAIDMIRLGDGFFIEGNYQAARLHYMTAQEIYRQANLHEFANRLDSKIEMAEYRISLTE